MTGRSFRRQWIAQRKSNKQNGSSPDQAKPGASSELLNCLWRIGLALGGAQGVRARRGRGPRSANTMIWKDRLFRATCPARHGHESQLGMLAGVPSRQTHACAGRFSLTEGLTGMKKRDEGATSAGGSEMKERLRP
jgi:hypothetical protein